VDTVEVWLIRLDRPDAETVTACLSPVERARAAALPEPRRQRFTLARAAARQLLSAHTGTAPHELVWCVGPCGKPRVGLGGVGSDGGGSGGGVGWRVPAFNLSHCGAVALLAVVPDGRREVGVDVERVVPGRAERLVERFFRPDEADQLRAVAPADRATEATRLWTRKEAYAKASGHRLLDVLQVPVLDRHAGRWPPGPAGGRRRLTDIAFAPAWTAALAVMGDAEFEVVRRTWSWPAGR
jgi:4'-phosphopantetheinyl transferase